MLKSFDQFISFLNTLPAECIALFELMLCLAVMFLLLRHYGLLGLYSYINVALIAANIQSLKGGQFFLISHPIVLGTLLFSTIALCFDIIVEYYGKARALNGVRLGFINLCLFTLLMLLTIAVRPLNQQTVPVDAISLLENHQHIKAIFLPLPGILLGSLVSYLISQYYDVTVFAWLKHMTHQHLLWLRTLFSTGLSALIDTCVFSILAWRLFNPQPVGWSTLIFTYILATYPLRLLCCFILMPAIYLARRFLPKEVL